jgi:hypothetical protein
MQLKKREEMKPTNKLRWLKKGIGEYVGNISGAVYADAVLQQLWEPEGTTEIASLDPEWRDVPTEWEPPK